MAPEHVSAARRPRTAPLEEDPQLLRSSRTGVAVINRPHRATCPACAWSLRSATAAGALVLAESHLRARHGR
jgi:hypothetical protein